MRRKEIDYAKGIGAMLVIFGHMTTYSRDLRACIYAFHMPLFFILGGILFYIGVGGYSCISKKVKNILIPALFFEVLMYLWVIVKSLVEHTYHGIRLIKREAGIFIGIADSDYSDGLWFFKCYFLAGLIMLVLVKISEKSKLLGIITILICYCVSFFYAKYMYVPLPWHIEVVPMAVFYMYVGYMTRSVNFQDMKRKPLLFSIGAGISCVLLYYCCIWKGYSYAMDCSIWGHFVLSPICALIACYTIILGCTLLSENVKWLSFIGRHSLEFYGIQAVMVGILNTICWKVFDDLYSWKGILVSLISLLISITVDSVFVMIYTRCNKRISWKK